MQNREHKNNHYNFFTRYDDLQKGRKPELKYSYNPWDIHYFA